MESFPNIRVENKEYPTVILGGDRFCGVFGKPRHRELVNKLTNPKYIYKIMLACYNNGFKGYDISGGFDHLTTAFNKLKNKYKDVIGIVNPNLVIYMNLNQDKAMATLFKDIFDKNILRKINKLPQQTKVKKFPYNNNSKPLTKKEIDNISINKKLLEKKLNDLEGLCDFCLIGSGPADYLPLLGRLDLFEDMIKMVRKKGFIPLSIHHWTSITLPFLDKLDFAGHWIYLNKKEQILSEKEVIKTIKQTKKPITAFKALLSRKEQDARDYLNYLFKKIKVDAVDFGVETTKEAKLSGNILKDIFSD